MPELIEARPTVGQSLARRRILARLWHDDRGQDVIEYALLAALIGLGSYGGFVLIQTTIYSSYIGWDGAQQGLWQPLNPGAYGS